MLWASTDNLVRRSQTGTLARHCSCGAKQICRPDAFGSLGTVSCSVGEVPQSANPLSYDFVTVGGLKVLKVQLRNTVSVMVREIRRPPSESKSFTQPDTFK